MTLCVLLHLLKTKIHIKLFSQSLRALIHSTEKEGEHLKKQGNILILMCAKATMFILIEEIFRYTTKKMPSYAILLSKLVSNLYVSLLHVLYSMESANKNISVLLYSCSELLMTYHRNLSQQTLRYRYTHVHTLLGLCL